MTDSPKYLDAEHREIDHLLAEVEYLAQRRSYGVAKRRFRDFREQLLAHLREEEDELFPAHLARFGDPQGVIAKLHEQHAQLETALEAVASALDQGDYAEFCYGLTALSTLLAAHQHTEEELWHRAGEAVQAPPP